MDQKEKILCTQKLKELLVAIAQDSMDDQKTLLTDILNEWKGDLEQIDYLYVNWD